MKDIKNLGAFAFQDEYGFLTAMEGSKWTELLKTYKKDYKKQLEPAKEIASTFANELQQQPSYTDTPSIDDVSYQMHGFQTIGWQMKNEKDYHIAADIDIDGKQVWAVEDRSEGAEQFTLCFYENGKEKWSYTKGVGPFVATVGTRCYVIELENFLWMRRVISVDKKTGKDRRVELDIKDPQWNLQLMKGTNGCLFVLANNAGVQRCWYKTNSSLKELTGYEAFVPIGYLTSTAKQPSFLAREKNSQLYKPVNCKTDFPSFEKKTPEWFDPTSNLLCTRSFGKRTVFNGKNAVFTTVANIDIDTLGSWRGHTPQITVQEPGAYRQQLESYLKKETLCSYAKSTYHQTVSKDGTSVSYILTSICKPKNLLCIVYGAYGVPTRMNTDRWKPLLDRGWGICIALVRGGGDHTDAWAEAARRGNKGKSIEDFEACIQAARKKFHVGASQTFLYGRSAGGYTVGAALARNSSGNLFQGVYTEVPYVDVLNTTSNPDLPLTKLEYDEFGNPKRLENAQMLLQLSPMDILPPTGAPRIFVLSRTALQDKEVYAYESVKWITKLRELEKGNTTEPFPKLLAFEEKEGHFATEATGIQQRANDMAILYSWSMRNKKSHERIYKMANTRRNNMSMRKRRNNVSMRKRRNNMTARKNNVAMGGKRRKSTRKSTRKAHRRH